MSQPITITDELTLLANLQARLAKVHGTQIAANQMTQEQADREKAVLKNTVDRLKCLKFLTSNLS